MQQILADFCLGFGVAVYGTLVGAGGGFLLVPVFLLLHKHGHVVAAGTSLAVVTVSALSATFGYVRDRKVDYRAGLVFAACTIPGAIAGGLTTNLVSVTTFQKVFGVAMCLVAIYLMLRGARRGVDPFTGRQGWGWITRPAYQYFEPVGAAFSVLVGVFSSWLGIGGGIIHVPFLTEVMRFPVHVAVATSQFVLLFTALTGVIVHLLVHESVHFATAMPAAAGALLGAQLGVRIARKVQGKLIVRALAVGMMLVGVKLLLA